MCIFFYFPVSALILFINSYSKKISIIIFNFYLSIPTNNVQLFNFFLSSIKSQIVSHSIIVKIIYLLITISL